MQPYFFPYLGYWQLIKAVDQFVIYDDVDYIKGGWINRNRILCQHQPLLVTLPLVGASANKKIDEISIRHQEYDIKKIENTLYHCYCRAKYFDNVFPLIQRTLRFEGTNLSHYLHYSITQVLQYLSISTHILVSSALDVDQSLHGKDRVISICQHLHADTYINAYGGQLLYDKVDFSDNGIKLFFAQMRPVQYAQFESGFVPNLSIIDVLMFNSPDEINQMLDAYTLI